MGRGFLFGVLALLTLGAVSSPTFHGITVTDGTNSYVIYPHPETDVRVDLSTARRLGFSDPDWVKITDDGAGSTGVYAQCFDATTPQEVFFDLQMPHEWATGSAIAPHIHWVPVTSGSGDVVWGLECVDASIDSVFGNSDLDSATDAAAETAYTHQIADFSSRDMTGHGISTLLICRVYRDAGNAADTYAADACALSMDFHVFYGSNGEQI